MKCPKCGYLGFEPVDRCRNCGYDFSLIPPAESPELPMREENVREVGPLDDLTLVDAAIDQASVVNLRRATPDLDRIIGVPTAPLSGELPLFGAPAPDEVPLITRASPPRAPLSVRRATPEMPRLRSVPARAPMLDLAPRAEEASAAGLLSGSEERQAGDELAGIAARVGASAIDLTILAAIDLVVVYFTMQICGLALDDLAILPKAPLVAFLLAQNAGYFVVFTTGGQTLGKMVAGIKVVPAQSKASIDLGHALVRTLVWIVLAVPAGLGFLTALFSRDRRGLHDRCAGTWVVRAAS